MNRAECLAMADKCVNNDRKNQYGEVENNFQAIANLWMGYLDAKGQDIDIEPYDVAAMMALLKVARIATGTATEDSWADLCGYGACGCELQTL